MPPSKTPDVMNVTIKHAGQSHSIDIDLSKSAIAFKRSIYEVTGVPTERMKVMVKGILKDDADLAKLGIKSGQTITVIGTAGPIPELPVEKILFLEDMDDSQLAQKSGIPPGLVNLGQTCYLNSTLQALRMVPQLQNTLENFSTTGPGLESRVAGSIKTLFAAMGKTTEAIPPYALLQSLRTLAPQFSETDQRGQYAQQDADEAWTQLISALRSSLPAPSGQKSLIDELMSIEVTKTLSSSEAVDEAPSTSQETVLKLECNIAITTNFLMSGILDNLDQQVEKHSTSLGRSAIYNAKSRISRLPSFLVVHMVRFYWRRDIQKKAKIMRKVKYPLQLDVLDIATDDLRAKLLPVNTAVKQILKNRDDRAKAFKQQARGRLHVEGEKDEDQIRGEERALIASLSRDNQATENGSSASGMYELCAMVTHKGPSAESGHYIGWTRKDDEISPSGEEPWYKFDDEKVSLVTADKILSMDGGGEDSVAYILVYRAIRI